MEAAAQTQATVTHIWTPRGSSICESSGWLSSPGVRSSPLPLRTGTCFFLPEPRRPTFNYGYGRNPHFSHSTSPYAAPHPAHTGRMDLSRERPPCVSGFLICKKKKKFFLLMMSHRSPGGQEAVTATGL